jgi:hypothetical protein
MINAQRARQQQALYARNERYRSGPSCSRYGPPAGDPYLMYGPGYGSGYGYGYGYEDYPYGGRRRRNNGAGALPLLGALAGGLLLGDILF